MDDRVRALIATAVASFLVPFMMSGVGIALPEIQTALSATAVELSWVEGAYMLSLSVILMPIGRIADIYGRRRVFIWGITWFTVVSMLASMAWSIQVLLVFRILQGVGAAMINSTGLAMITAMYQPQERGRVMGIVVGCVYAGLSLGPLLGGACTLYLGWRSVFYLSLPFGLAAWALAKRISREWRPAQSESFDYLGSVLFGGFVVSLMKGLTGLVEPLIGGSLLVLAALLLLGFVIRSKRVAHPMLDLALFSGNRVFSLSSLATLINYAGTFTVSFLLSLYLQVVKGFSPAQAGTILIIQPVVQAALSPLAGTLSDRWNASFMATMGMGLCGIGLFCLSRLDALSSLGLVGVYLTVMGLGFALFASPNMSVIMGSVAKKDYSTASSVVGSMRTFGMSLSMGLVTVVFGANMHGQQIETATIVPFLGCMRQIFGICALLSVAGIFCSLGRFGTKVQPG